MKNHGIYPLSMRVYIFKNHSIGDFPRTRKGMGSSFGGYCVFGFFLGVLFEFFLWLLIIPIFNYCQFEGFSCNSLAGLCINQYDGIYWTAYSNVGIRFRLPIHFSKLDEGGWEGQLVVLFFSLYFFIYLPNSIYISNKN